MKLKVFERITTTESLNNLVDLLKAIAQEHNIDERKCFVVDDIRYKNATYVMSTSRNGCPVRHFLVYDGVVPNTVGLLGLDSCSNKVFEIAKPDYLSFIYLHNRVWLALRPDSMLDLFVDDKVVGSGVVSHDVISISGLNFVQLNFSDGRGLLCCDSDDPFGGLFVPKNKSDFKKYFDKMLYMRGREGYWDEFNLSGIFGCYYEVVNTIFEGHYIKLDLQ